MAKYRVYGIMMASKYFGDYEAENEDAATEMAEEQHGSHVNICHQCSGEIDLGEIYKFEAEKTA